MHYVGTVNEIVWYWHMNRQINKTEKSTKLDPSKYGNLVYDKGIF